MKNKGKIVIVVSAKNHISKELIDSSHKYIDLKKLKVLLGRENKK
ncbi:MAG: hypothetical protein PHU56_04030 [Candidatus Pacebacteria bacterium]|nr:hypothetical protein [Candidatus Paceibacterota bacterium]